MTQVTNYLFGETKAGQEVTAFVLENEQMFFEVLEYGCTLRRVIVKDKTGVRRDVVLGFNNMQGYEEQDVFIGCVAGRCANRIRAGRFTLEGVDYQLAVNNGANHLHGGVEGFNRKVWKGRVEGERVVFSLTSPNGEESYPGTLQATVTYSLEEDNSICIAYSATTDQTTVVNLTNHSYFNLGGLDCTDIKEHLLQSSAQSFVELAADGLPTGILAPVQGTPFDFTQEKTVGSCFKQGCPQIAFVGGFDHCMVFDQGLEGPVAVLCCPETGIQMEMFTTYPGAQFYSSNFLTGAFVGKKNIAYNKHAALCMEAQYYPDAIHIPHFPQPILKAGEKYSHSVRYRFGVR